MNGREINHKRALQHQETKSLENEDVSDIKKNLLFNADMAIDTQIFDWGNLAFMSQVPALPGSNKPAHLRGGRLGCMGSEGAVPKPRPKKGQNGPASASGSASSQSVPSTGTEDGAGVAQEDPDLVLEEEAAAEAKNKKGKSKISAEAALKLQQLEAERKKILMCQKWSKNIKTTYTDVMASIQAAMKYEDLDGFKQTCKSWMKKLIVLGPDNPSWTPEVMDNLSETPFLLSPNTDARRKKALDNPTAEDLQIYEDALKGRLRDVNAGKRKLDTLVNQAYEKEQQEEKKAKENHELPPKPRTRKGRSRKQTEAEDKMDDAGEAEAEAEAEEEPAPANAAPANAAQTQTQTPVPDVVSGVKTHGCAILAALIEDLASTMPVSELGWKKRCTTTRAVRHIDLDDEDISDADREHDPLGCNIVVTPVLLSFHDPDIRMDVSEPLPQFWLDHENALMTATTPTKLADEEGVSFASKVFHRCPTMLGWVNFKTATNYLHRKKLSLRKVMTQAEDEHQYDEVFLKSICHMQMMVHQPGTFFCGVHELMLGRVVVCLQGQRLVLGVAAHRVAESFKERFGHDACSVAQLASWTVAMDTDRWATMMAEHDAFFSVLRDGDVLIVPPGFFVIEACFNEMVAKMVSWAYIDPCPAWMSLFDRAVDAIQETVNNDPQSKWRLQFSFAKRLLKACLVVQRLPDTKAEARQTGGGPEYAYAMVGVFPTLCKSKSTFFISKSSTST